MALETGTNLFLSGFVFMGIAAASVREDVNRLVHHPLYLVSTPHFWDSSLLSTNRSEYNFVILRSNLCFSLRAHVRLLGEHGCLAVDAPRDGGRALVGELETQPRVSYAVSGAHP